jgi:hypothetical protein
VAKEMDFDGYRVSNLRYPVVSVTGGYTAGSEDYVILSSGGSITLPNASTHQGKIFIIKSDGLPTNLGVLLPLPNLALLTVAAGSCMHIISDGTTWVDITPEVGETP